MKRLEAWKEYNSDPFIEEELISYFKKRLCISDKEYEDIMKSKPLFCYNYLTYKKRFEFLRPVLFL